ncbi:hypothetical protein BDN70DRAFT_993541 [Pholiota conissans]|uniref:Uncharacterized protein n=1 Tax=Pholiota conissans TaxID=109636 RepID=A0A9P5Z4J0_9AGAR|nr:hypothetical protein BDN70DRAFT_993541 [Pholiota conissans]
MASQTAPNHTFARFSRGGFGFSSRNDTKKKAGDDEDWYIPYNGPVELPRDAPRREKLRDSWGDVLEDFDDGVLGDEELQLRYGGDFNNSRTSSGRFTEEERKGRSRDRTFSVASGRTTSSGAMDPGRGSFTLNRRSTVSTSNPPPLPSYVNIDAIGGVGESPVPHIKNSKDAHRISIASIFSFGALNRKSATSPFSELKTSRSRAKTLLQEKEKTHGKFDSFGRGSVSSDSHSKSGPNENQHRRPQDKQADRLNSTVTDDEDYYNSYYQTLIPPPNLDHTKLAQNSPTASSGSRGSSQRGGVSRQNSTSTTSPHPYAYAFPSTEIPQPPQSAPLTLTPHPSYHPGPSIPPRLTFTTPGAGPSSSGVLHARSAFSPIASGSKAVKNSTSTPNLRNGFSPSPRSSPTGRTGSNAKPQPINTSLAVPTFVFPKGKERWLSAETWCDALLFPRPRLRLKQEILPSDAAPQISSSGRIVSPPMTPTEQEFEMQQKEPGIASRVLAHSRSLVDLRLGKGKKKEEDEPPKKSILVDGQKKTGGAGQTLRPPRPKSFAMDDLALPSPVPSLAHVLREGAQLESDRKAWQRQAQNSFGNKRSRTVSRTRSKSLTQRAHQQGHQHQSSMEYITAQACLGSQNYSPAIAPPRLAYFSDGTSTLTSKASHSQGSHSHSNSLVKSFTKSTKTHSRTHSRNDSWSKSAMKVPASKPLGGSNSGLLPADPFSVAITPAQQKVADLEGALKGQGTRFIRLADPAHLPVDRGLPTYPSTSTNTTSGGLRKTPSPAFSNLSDSKVGIALGTPPEEEADAGANYLPSHPYAHGGLSFSKAAEQRHADFAGPHPSVTVAPATQAPPISEILARHKLPPHLVLHPYAQPPSNRDSYIDANGFIAQFRSDDTTPHASKMWAQLSPFGGVVQEVLSGDLRYSPFSPEDGNSASRNTLHIHDIVGVGETLVNATRYHRASPDSGLGTSESHGNNSLGSQNQQRVVLQPSKGQELDLPEFGPGDGQDNDGESSRFVADQEQEVVENAGGHSIFASNRTLASSDYDYLSLPPQGHRSRGQSPASAMTSESSSPQQSPQPLGSPHDLESFQDLFFRPSMNMNSSQRTPIEAALPESPSHRTSTPWDNSMRSHRTDSSLTNLARQLNDEFEQMARDHERESSQYSQSVVSSMRQQSRRPTEASLQFVFEEMQRSASPVEDNMADPIQAFKPSGRLPEDVISSRASSFIENSTKDDPTAVFRVGMVESVSTPPPVSTEHHLSFIGQTHDNQDQQVQQLQQRRGLASPASPDSHARVLSGLLPPSTEATRSSYMTTSTLSRMSNLSDFPAPPKDNNRTVPKHMSLLSSYFDEAISQSEAQPEAAPTAPSTLLEEDRVTFGGNLSANDLAKTLSSPQPEPF